MLDNPSDTPDNAGSEDSALSQFLSKEVACSMDERSRSVLVTDFDGTMARGEFYLLVKQHLVPPGTPDYWGEYLAGRLTHFKALQLLFAAIRATPEEMLATTRRMDVDPALHEAVARLRATGWDVVIASAGCEWYIRRLLADHDVDVTLYANPGSFDPAHGLTMDYPVGSRFFSADNGIDKAAIVRDALNRYERVAFAGDGRPDAPAAMLVPPARRFARGWLAGHLTTEHVPFRGFEWWSEIARMLLEEDGC